MNLAVVARFSGFLVAIVATLMLAPAVLALFDRDGRALVAYTVSTALAFTLAVLLRRIGRDATEEIHRKDAFGVVALTWLAVGLLGGLPFVLEGSITDPASAIFEAVSGFTTTGATVVGDIDGLSRATNLWRCLMHWVGGMGIVVLFVAVFPQLGVGAKHLFRSEVAGPITSGLRPKIRQTATALWWIYGGLTLAAAVLLVFAGMPMYDAICHAMSALGTGGFSTRTASIGAYDSMLIEGIVIVFMLLGGLNFGLFYDLLRGNGRNLVRDYELRFFLATNTVVTLLVAATTLDRHHGVVQTLRHAAFQTVAVTSTTGFMTEDYDTYPNLAKLALVFCMFMGGCAGSTAGGLKASRVYILIKTVVMELGALVRPKVVSSLQVGRGTVPPTIIRSILTFFAAYMLLVAVSSFVLVAMDLDLTSAISASLACLSSVGPGLEQVGPAKNFALVPPAGKVMLSLCMIAGRLEIFALFAVLSPECWRR